MAIDLTTEEAREIEFTIKRIGTGKRGDRYRVFNKKAVVVKSSRNPEFDACRWALGKAKTALFKREGLPTHMTMNIAWGAQRTISETETRGMRTVKWRPYGKDQEGTRGVDDADGG